MIMWISWMWPIFCVKNAPSRLSTFQPGLNIPSASESYRFVFEVNAAIYGNMAWAKRWRHLRVCGLRFGMKVRIT